MATAQPVIERILLFGDPHGLPQCLAVLPRGRLIGLVGAEIRPQQHLALGAFAARHRLPLLIQPKPGTAAFELFLEAVRDLAPDLILVNSYSMRLPATLLAFPRHGAVNVHGALLPQYRGASPLQNALLNGEQETGTTLHVMTPEFDAGPIIAQRRVPIRFEDTWLDVYRRIARATEEMLRDVAPRLLSLTHESLPQDERAAHYYKRRHPQDGRIDWNMSVRHIYNLVRALVRPHPGAFFPSGNQTVVVDEYLPLSAIAALKFSPHAGGRVLRGPVAELIPSGATEAAWPALQGMPHHRMTLSIHVERRAVGVAEIRRIDGASGTAEVHVNWHRAPQAGLYREVLQLLLRFVFDELQLRSVSIGERCRRRDHGQRGQQGHEAGFQSHLIL